jgi:hypothetical protein
MSESVTPKSRFETMSLVVSELPLYLRNGPLPPRKASIRLESLILRLLSKLDRLLKIPPRPRPRITPLPGLRPPRLDPDRLAPPRLPTPRDLLLLFCLMISSRLISIFTRIRHSFTGLGLSVYLSQFIKDCLLYPENKKQRSLIEYLQNSRYIT